MFLDFIYSIPSLLLYGLISFFVVIFSLLLLLVVRYFMPRELRSKSNDIISPLSGTISVSYAIVVGLIAISVLNTYDKATSLAHEESYGVSDIFKFAKLLPEKERIKVEELTKKYLLVVTEEEWKSMKKGISSTAADSIINELFDFLAKNKGNDMGEILILNEMYKTLNNLDNIKHRRYVLANSTMLVNEAWIVIVVGAVLVLFINCFFDADLHLHIAALATLALSISLVIFLTTALDYPYRGTFSIQPNALKSLYRELKIESTQQNN